MQNSVVRFDSNKTWKSVGTNGNLHFKATMDAGYQQLLFFSGKDCRGSRALCMLPFKLAAQCWARDTLFHSCLTLW